VLILVYIDDILISLCSTLKKHQKKLFKLSVILEQKPIEIDGKRREETRWGY